jgi:hypothetical protein
MRFVDESICDTEEGKQSQAGVQEKKFVWPSEKDIQKAVEDGILDVFNSQKAQCTGSVFLNEGAYHSLAITKDGETMPYFSSCDARCVSK